MTTTENTTKTLLRKLDRTLTALAAQKIKEVDLTPVLEEAASEFNFEREIGRAVENYNFDDAIEEAVRNFDFASEIEKSVDFTDEAEEAVGEALSKADIAGKVEDAVTAKLDEVLPRKVEESLFKLLERPEVAERLVRVLFDRAAS